MPKKHTYEHVKNYIESVEKYKLLSEEYSECMSKLKLQCLNGHIFWMNFNNFKNGQRCPECSNKNKGNYHKLTYEQIKCYIEKQGYKLLSKNYKNNSTKLKLKCSEGHTF